MNVNFAENNLPSPQLRGIEKQKTKDYI